LQDAKDAASSAASAAKGAARDAAPDRLDASGIGAALKNAASDVRDSADTGGSF
jgi:hypothetical protein